MLPQLISIDSNEITPKERILANQRFDELMEELDQEIEKKAIADSKKTPEEREKEYGPETRREMYKEQQQQNEQREKDRLSKNEQPEVKNSSIYNKDGELRQCNEGKYEFLMKEWDDPVFSFFEMKIPKYLETSNCKVELFPNFVSVR
jgi:protein TilB